MSFTYSQDITIISLLLSTTALIVVVIVGILLSRQKNQLNLESSMIDASALVQEFGERQKRLERKMIDEKVRLEILELRLFKESRGVSPSPSQIGQTAQGIRNYEPTLEPRLSDQNSKGSALDQVVDVRASAAVVSSSSRRDKTVTEILEAVMVGRGNITARQIQERIRRSREHTARMMNLLYKQGLVSRDTNMRPFTYSLTEAGMKELDEQI
ncbi:MAG: hypothetical protein PXY39_06310 [archaeon]|nr:hypothetical protein [archaeon]